MKLKYFDDQLNNQTRRTDTEFFFERRTFVFLMDNWVRENNDSPVGVNGFVDNMQLLWKLQSLEPLMSTGENNDGSQSFTDFNQSASTSDLPDEDDDLVDKLFRESLAMQGNIPFFFFF